ncbi:hypothetical protein E4U54_000469 [Claviceps lovelessii]|nr:hypothetical protein E4U54_000469 [Claviceps lovelessii]
MKAYENEIRSCSHTQRAEIDRTAKDAESSQGVVRAESDIVEYVTPLNDYFRKMNIAWDGRQRFATASKDIEEIRHPGQQLQLDASLFFVDVELRSRGAARNQHGTVTLGGVAQHQSLSPPAPLDGQWAMA